tara:strand:+ start:1140 stop:1766 length:627 start_codon:yes stop_codon:yes gene_type:complete
MNQHPQNMFGSFPPPYPPIIMIPPTMNHQQDSNKKKVILIIILISFLIYAYWSTMITYKQLKSVVGKDTATYFNDFIYTHIPKTNRFAELDKKYPDLVFGGTTSIDKYTLIRLGFVEMDTSGSYRTTQNATKSNMRDIGYMFAYTRKRKEEYWVTELDETFMYPTKNGVLGDLPELNKELYRKNYTELYKEYIKGYISGASDRGIPEP